MHIFKPEIRKDFMQKLNFSFTYSLPHLPLVSLFCLSLSLSPHCLHSLSVFISQSRLSLSLLRTYTNIKYVSQLFKDLTCNMLYYVANFCSTCIYIDIETQRHAQHPHTEINTHIAAYAHIVIYFHITRMFLSSDKISDLLFFAEY